MSSTDVSYNSSSSSSDFTASSNTRPLSNISVVEPISTPSFVKLDNFEENTKCSLCCSNVTDTLKYGEIYKIKDIVCHYYCLLFSSSLIQNGTDTDGILGFLPCDIKKEMRRGGRLRCSFCRKAGATIGCHLKSCRKTFHLPCGIRHGSMHQFFESFVSFCGVHRPSQKVDLSVIKKAEEGEDSLLCPICYDDVQNRVSVDTLWAPCCRKRWFHRTCVQRQALSQGYFFRCPLCNNKEIFIKEMKKFGIYIPERDAAWEHEPRAFQELLHTYRRCDAEKCKCPSGRNLSQNTGSWRLIRCNACGSQGIHIACGGLKIAAASNSWRCLMCVETLTKVPSRPSLSEDRVTASLPASSSSAASVPSSSRSSSHRPTGIAGPQPKRRKSSKESFELGSSNESEEVKLEEIQNPPQLVQMSGTTQDDDSDENAIIIVDDSESEVEIVNEVLLKQPVLPLGSSSSHLPSLNTDDDSTELLTSEGKRIKVYKVSEGYHALSTGLGEVGGINQSQVKEEVKQDFIRKTESHSHDSQISKGHVSVIKHSSTYESTSTKETEVTTKTEEKTSLKLPTSEITDKKMGSSASDVPNEMERRGRPSEFYNSFRPMYPFPYFLPQPPIYYCPIRTFDGREAMQPMVPVTQFPLTHQPPNRERNQSSPDIITLD